MRTCAREWLYIAAQPSGIIYGPTKIGWSGRTEPNARIAEHERVHRGIELVVAFGLPCPTGWALERQVHKRLRRYRLAQDTETEWYCLSPNECVIKLCRLINTVVESPGSEVAVSVETGPGWDRLLDNSAAKRGFRFR